MTRLFYERHVPEDPLLAPLFADMTADHPRHVAERFAQACGRPKSDPDDHRGDTHIIDEYLRAHLTEEQRARWVTLLLRSADEAGLPRDPQFRSAFTGYLEWGSRAALENAQSGADPSEQIAVPKWSWGNAGPPPSRTPAPETTDRPDEQPVVVPGPDETVTFDKHIKTLFRAKDQQSMKFAFDLWSYNDVKAHARDILERVQNGSMPCDGAWPAERVDAFERWVTTGTHK